MIALTLTCVWAGHRRLAHVATDSDDEASPVPTPDLVHANALQLWRFASHETASHQSVEDDAADMMPVSASQGGSEQQQEFTFSHSVPNHDVQPAKLILSDLRP